MAMLARDDWPNARLVALREAIGNGAHADDAKPEAHWRRKVERMRAAEFGEGNPPPRAGEGGSA